MFCFYNNNQFVRHLCLTNRLQTNLNLTKKPETTLFLPAEQKKSIDRLKFSQNFQKKLFGSQPPVCPH
jgi:hypothetical protein